jgi:hypothetical protein
MYNYYDKNNINISFTLDKIKKVWYSEVSCGKEECMLNEDVISGWKFLAEQGTLFHPETILALIQHIEEQNKIIEGLTCELELRDYIYNRNEVKM